MTDDFDLLDGIEPPDEGIVRIGQSEDSKRAHEAWSLWVAVTKRPDKGKIDRKFMNTYIEALRQNRSHEKLLDIVRGAARLPVRGNDSKDVRRLISAITSPNVGKTATSAYLSGEQVVPFPSLDDKDLACTIKDVVEACRVPTSQWTERDQDAAGIIMDKMTAEEVNEAADNAARALGTEGVLPVDILRSANSRKPTKAKANASRSTYAAGQKERESIKGVEFSLDDAANALLLEGGDPKRIIALHQNVPEGYWDAVFDLVATGYSNARAYDVLRERFDGWHPSERQA